MRWVGSAFNKAGVLHLVGQTAEAAGREYHLVGHLVHTRAAAGGSAKAKHDFDPMPWQLCRGLDLIGQGALGEVGSFKQQADCGYEVPLGHLYNIATVCLVKRITPR